MQIIINPSKRVTFTLAVILGVLGIILLVFRYDLLFEVFNINYPIILSVNIILLLTSIFIFAYLYLQGYLRISSSLTRIYDDDIRSRNELSYGTLSRSEELRDRINLLESKISKYTFQRTSISEDEKNNILNDIKIELKSNLNKELLNEIENKYSDKIIKSVKFQLIRDDFVRISNRISKEIYAVGRRANINLLIGSFTTLMAVGILVYWVFSYHNQFNNLTNLFSNYIPRLTIIIFIELFAYFFLKLYKNNLQDIKYFQNELTNIESKFSSLRAAITLSLDNSIDYAIKSLSDTERNIISTEDLGKYRLGINRVYKLMKSINSSIKNLKG